LIGGRVAESNEEGKPHEKIQLLNFGFQIGAIILACSLPRLFLLLAGAPPLKLSIREN